MSNNMKTNDILSIALYCTDSVPTFVSPHNERGSVRHRHTSATSHRYSNRIDMMCEKARLAALDIFFGEIV